MAFHLAVIPDGNRRWAKQQGVSGYTKLYHQGVERVIEVAEAAFDSGVTHLSLWGSSHANIANRQANFFNSIDAVYRDAIHQCSHHPMIEQYAIKIQVLGEWRDSLSKETISAIDAAQEKTANNRGAVLTLLLDYSGERERTAALIAASQQPIAHTIEQAHTVLHDASWTHMLPPVDLIIRTGAWKDPHNSAGFLSLLADEAQYSFPEVLWPDFSSKKLREILDDYSTRERRRGK